jgi:hypothetical protein
MMDVGTSIIVSKQTAPLLAIVAFLASVPLARPIAAQQLMAANSDSLTLPNAPTPTYSSSLQAQQQTTPSPTQQTPDNQNLTPEQRRAQAAAELKLEETQRMAGVIPNFNTVNNGNAQSITPSQKFQLFFKGAFDPYQFALAGIDAGIGQAENSNPGYNQGLKGFGRRYGANYGDNFDGNFWGNAVLPSLLHQDPRYFRLGNGSILHRGLYSISTTLRTRGDNGNWQPAYSNLLGNLIGASISNVYYPDGDRGLYPTLRRGLSVTYQGTLGGLLQEFYPDVAQHYKNHRAKKAPAAAILPPPDATTSPTTPPQS